MLKELAPHPDKIIESKFCNESKNLITGSIDGKIKIWDWYNSLEIVELDSKQKKLSCLDFDGELLVCGYLNKKVEIYDSIN